MLPKVKFLTAVWGDAYIQRFAELALPSFLAPGNLPALAAGSDLEIVILTRQSDVEKFGQHAMFHGVRAISALRFIPIDDLIVGKVYGVTLTLAYTRAVVACGADMVNTHFVFMNADFVLANGSLRSLLHHIVAGRSIVLGPSFRAIAEAVEPHLRTALRDATGVLAIAPRDLASLSLPHPHSTTFAKTVTQDFCHSVQPNQFFWQVDDKTVLARYYLIFMLCLKPERVINSINSYCDYAFIPELCPSGDEAVMGDSDDFFMLELQEREQEAFMLRLGRLPEAGIAASLGTWTTAEHRRAAHHDIVFHSGDVPAELDAAKKEAGAFVDRIGRLLGPPVPHAWHWHWVGAVELFRFLLRKHGVSRSPSELGRVPIRLPPRALVGYALVWAGQSIRRLGRSAAKALLEKAPQVWAGQSIRRLGRSAAKALLGKAPQVTKLHPSWLDYRLLRDTLDGILAESGARALVVRKDPALTDGLVQPGAALRFATPAEVTNGCVPLLSGAACEFTHILICVPGEDYECVPELVDLCLPLVADPNRGCQVLIHHLGEELSGEHFQGVLMRYLEDIVEWPPRAREFSFVGGRLKRFNRRWLRHQQFQFVRYRARALLWAGPMAAIGMPLTLLVNLYLGRKQPTDRFVRFCSSMLFRVGPRTAGAAIRPVSVRRRPAQVAGGTAE